MGNTAKYIIGGLLEGWGGYVKSEHETRVKEGIARRQEALQRLQIESNERIAQGQQDTNRMLGQLQSKTSVDVANIGLKGTMDTNDTNQTIAQGNNTTSENVAKTAAGATVGAAKIAADASRDTTKMTVKGQEIIAQIKADADRDVAEGNNLSNENVADINGYWAMRVAELEKEGDLIEALGKGGGLGSKERRLLLSAAFNAATATDPMGAKTTDYAKFITMLGGPQSISQYPEVALLIKQELARKAPDEAAGNEAEWIDNELLKLGIDPSSVSGVGARPVNVGLGVTAPQEVQGAVGTQDNPHQPATEADIQNVPVGEYFLGPDGKVYIRQEPKPEPEIVKTSLADKPRSLSEAGLGDIGTPSNPMRPATLAEVRNVPNGAYYIDVKSKQLIRKNG